MTGTQLQLPMPLPRAPGLNLTGLVMSLMADGAWWTPYQLQRAIEALYGEWHSDASITARIRDGRKQAYGGHVIEKRMRVGTKSYEYRMGY
jgi:hypothetical protein